MLASERKLAAKETVQILGVCLYLHSCKLTGIRVGRTWLIPEAHLAVHLGMQSLILPSSPTVSQEVKDNQIRDGVVFQLLRTIPFRGRIRELVLQRAVEGSLSPIETSQLFYHLDLVLREAE